MIFRSTPTTDADDRRRSTDADDRRRSTSAPSIPSSGG
jgi:hypothetical protein